MEKTFGEAFGELIREKRGQEGLTQKELAIRAFNDESKVRRIIELEKGAVKRPQVKTIDALKVYFNITNEEIEKCRRHGLFTSSEQLGVGLSRNLMENLAQRFEHDNPDAPDEELISHLKAKAVELKQLKKRLSKLESTTRSLHNQIASANAVLELGHFEEADQILAAAEEIQEEQRTIKEIRTQSQIRFARGDTALLSGQSSTAAGHYIKAAEYFLGFDKTEVVEILTNAAGRIYEFERRRRNPRFADAIDLTTRALALTSPDANTGEWVRTKYHLALLQQVESRVRKPKSSDLLNEAIANIHEALKRGATVLEDFDWASLMILLGNSYMERAQRSDNAEWEKDVDEAIRIFEELTRDVRIEKSGLHRCHLYNNISTAYRHKSRRSNAEVRSPLVAKAKQALLRAIELSTQEGQIHIWSAAQSNLAGC